MNYRDQIRSKNNDELAKWLACETCKYSDECNDEFESGHEHCDRLYNSYKSFLDTKV